LSVSRATTGRGNTQATSAPHLEPPVDINLESGDTIVELEGDADVAPKVEGVPDGAFR
jgi:hypothetical protein